MTLKQQIDRDLKTALLNGDKQRAMVLRGLKNSILYYEVASNARDTEITDEETMKLLLKESKKRQESADLYSKYNEEERAEAELNEKMLIDAYLPKQLSETELEAIIDEVVQSTGATNIQTMGQVINQVKSKVGASADGAEIARLAQVRLSAI
jgi:hypothetical protein